MKEKEEPKECTDASSSGSFDAPAFSVLKKDIHKFKPKTKEISEVADASISAGAMYDAPIGHKAKDPLAIDNPGLKKSKKASGTIMANQKIDKNSIAVKKPNFPKFGGPETKFVSINPKTQDYPYSNQGDPKNSKLYEIHGMKEAIEEAAKKYGHTIKEIEDMIVKESSKINEGIEDIDFSPVDRWMNPQEEQITYHLATKEPVDIKTHDKVELAKLKLLFYKYDVPFHVQELK